MQVVILAGGLGTRLRPYTYATPKPMMPINAKPFLEHQLILLKEQGLRDIVICVGYLGDRIVDYFGDGSRFGLSIRYSHEPQPLGTGGAIKRAESLLEDRFIVLNGDTFLSFDYGKVITAFEQRDTLGLMVVYDNRIAIGISNVALDEDGFVMAYNKYRSTMAMGYLDAGVTLFKKEMLSLIAKGKAVSLEEGVFPQLIADHQLAAYPTRQRFYDIGTPEGLDSLKGILK